MGRPTDWSLELLNQLEWKRFEEVCAGFWKAKGYPAKLNDGGPDGGVDVIIQDKSDSTKVFAVIQCKASGEKRGVDDVRALWGAMHHFSAKMAIFYGRSGFTQHAIDFAQEKHLKLASGEDLLAMIRTLDQSDQKWLLDHVTRDDYTTPTCVKCNIKLVVREAKKGEKKGNRFWGCTNYPKCKTNMHYSD